jgi:hypothetical protein
MEESCTQPLVTESWSMDVRRASPIATARFSRFAMKMGSHLFSSDGTTVTVKISTSQDLTPLSSAARTSNRNRLVDGRPDTCRTGRVFLTQLDVASTDDWPAPIDGWPPLIRPAHARVQSASRIMLTSLHRVELARDPSWPQKSHVSSHIPNRHHRTNPTPPDGELGDFRSNPTPPDHSDRLLPPHNPSVVGSIPTGPTSKFGEILNPPAFLASASVG